MKATKGRQLTVCLVILLGVSFAGSVTINYTTNQVISSHDYPQPYPSGVRDTWVWTKDTGLWGVKFIDVDLTAPDYIVINDYQSVPKYFYKRGGGRIDTLGSRLNITFYSGNSSNKGRGFKLDIRHGRDKGDLDLKFLNDNSPPPTDDEPDVGTILPILLAIATIVLLIFLVIVTWFICQRRRRRQQQEVSLSVNVQGGIRRDSGVRYTRKHSTQSQLDDPPSPRKTNLVRSNSNRSWMVRAELTATTSSVQAPSGGNCNGNGTVHTVPNVYTAMENDRPAEKVYRSRIPTLERVPEDQLMVKVPTQSLEVSQDDGYLGPNPKSPAVSYLNYPVSSCQREVTKFATSAPTGRCDDGYQNITVTGRLGIS